ncbi:hypothetical protein MrNuV_ORF016 [Macrobrachium rosenbergii nudivirus]|nr:hypothetical protein MrNuV_ORF016 [Macrobrachium rosenbergii nudivirus]
MTQYRKTNFRHISNIEIYNVIYAIIFGYVKHIIIISDRIQFISNMKNVSIIGHNKRGIISRSMGNHFVFSFTYDKIVNYVVMFI